MRKLLVLIIGIFISLRLFAQLEDASKYANTINDKDLRDLLSVIASDVMEGRETGERGQKMAAAFIQHHFQKLGLEPVVKNGDKLTYIQEIPLMRSTPDETFIKVGDNKLINLKDFIYWGEENQDEIQKKEIVFVGDGGESIYNDVEVKNKAVLIIPGTGLRSFRTKSQLAQKKGAAAIFMVLGESDEEFRGMLGRYARFLSVGRLKIADQEAVHGSAGMYLISPALAESIFSTSKETLQKVIEDHKNGKTKSIKSIKSGRIEYQSKQIINRVTSENVLGYLEGTDKKDELIIITAHYDHIGKDGDKINNGADDDGSGTSAVLEIAEAFVQAKKDGKGPRRSILFMTVTGEEKGLLGSEYYVTNPVFPLKNTVANLNIDMIGRVDEKHQENPNYVYLVGSDRLSTELHELSEKVNHEHFQLELDYTFNDENHPDRIYYRSDHWNFAQHNIPIIFYFNGTHEDYHKPSDTIDKINFDQLRKRAQLVFETAWVISNRDERLVVDKIQDTTIDSGN